MFPLCLPGFPIDMRILPRSMLPLETSPWSTDSMLGFKEGGASVYPAGNLWEMPRERERERGRERERESKKERQMTHI